MIADKRKVHFSYGPGNRPKCWTTGHSLRIAYFWNGVSCARCWGTMGIQANPKTSLDMLVRELDIERAEPVDWAS